MAGRSQATNDDTVTAPRTGTRPKVVKPELYKVLLHNDDYTTMDFVIQVLMTVFHHETEQATRIMLNVHEHGVGVAGAYPYEIADTKARKVMELARAAEFPLLCTIEAE